MQAVNFDDIVFWSVKTAVLSGRVRGMYKDETVNPARIMIEIVDVRKLGTDIRSNTPMYVPLNTLHDSEQACRAEIHARLEAERDVYRKEINTVNDLVCFLLTHDAVSETCDPRVREVALEKAQSLLNISPSKLRYPKQERDYT